MAMLLQRSEFLAIAAKLLRKLDDEEQGIRFADFAKICVLSGVPKAVKKLIQTPVSKLFQSEGLSLAENVAHSVNILQALIDQLRCFRTAEEYVWLIRTTMAVMLVKVASSRPQRLVSTLLSAIESLNRSSFTHHPAMVEAVAKGLKNAIPLPTVGSLVCLIDRLSRGNCPLLHCAAVALIFVGIDEILYPKKKAVEYRVRGIEDIRLRLLKYNQQYRWQNKTDRMSILYQLLQLLHAYQLVVIMPQLHKSKHELQEDHGENEEHFRMDHGVLVAIGDWLKSIPKVVHSFSAEDKQLKDRVHKLLERNMIPLASKIIGCSSANRFMSPAKDVKHEFD